MVHVRSSGSGSIPLLIVLQGCRGTLADLPSLLLLTYYSLRVTQPMNKLREEPLVDCLLHIPHHDFGSNENGKSDQNSSNTPIMAILERC